MAKHVEIVSDVNLNDSDKTFTVPSGQTYHVQWFSARLTPSATVGNRLLRWELQNSAGTVLMTAGRTNPLATGTVWTVIGSPLAYALGAAIDPDGAVFHLPIPVDFKIPAGYKLRVYDQAIVDPAADDMLVYLGVEIESI